MSTPLDPVPGRIPTRILVAGLVAMMVAIGLSFAAISIYNGPAQMHAKP
jgi:hypothetical protein